MNNMNNINNHWHQNYYYINIKQQQKRIIKKTSYDNEETNISHLKRYFLAFFLFNKLGAIDKLLSELLETVKKMLLPLLQVYC